jgi:peptidoglycan/LPS O-acetylase OafA/YrhL
MNAITRFPAFVPARPRSAHDRYLATKHFASLDGLRFLCIAAVLWHHSPALAGMSDPSVLATRGFLGVDFFFILSGFLITTLLLREERTTGRFSLAAFYWRRALRILPAYLCVVGAMATYFIAVKGQTQYLEVLPNYLLFSSNLIVDHIPLLAPTWSLAVEEQYYLLWPLVLLCVPRRFLLAAVVTLVVVNVGINAGAVIETPSDPIGPLGFAPNKMNFAPILIGSLIALLLRDERFFDCAHRLLGNPWAPVVAFGNLVLLLQLAPANLMGLPNLQIHLMMGICLITLILRVDHKLAAVLAWAPIARIGKISYGIYLYHLIALHVATMAAGALGGAAVVMPVYLVASIAMAEISFRTIEAWPQRFKHWTPLPATSFDERPKPKGRRIIDDVLAEAAFREKMARTRTPAPSKIVEKLLSSAPHP